MSALDYSSSYDPDVDFDRLWTEQTAERIAQRICPGDRVLELGCATGRMTATLVAAGAQVLGIDRSPAYLRRAAARGLPNADFRVGELERPWAIAGCFEHVVATNVLQELDDPLTFLRAARARLAPRGLLHLTTPNPRSLHRIVALEMGLIDDLATTSARGEQWGTRALWTHEELRELAAEAGLATVGHEGIALKPLPNDEMAALPDDVLAGFLRAGNHVPEHAALTYLLLCQQL